MWLRLGRIKLGVGGSVQVPCFRQLIHTHAPWGCIVRAASHTKSNRIERYSCRSEGGRSESGDFLSIGNNRKFPDPTQKLEAFVKDRNFWNGIATPAVVALAVLSTRELLITERCAGRKRGGGTICIHNIELWKSMRALVASTDPCVPLPEPARRP